MADYPDFLASTLDNGRSLAAASKTRYGVPFRRGTLEVGLYAPRGEDPQQPHARDEVYLVVNGSGAFVAGDERRDFSAGDVLFVAANVQHRFVDFSDDLEVWVVFYGPEGGETGA
jgi:mannose-6-phosphate isomerase-like protein (cupin superfamily)